MDTTVMRRTDRLRHFINTHAGQAAWGPNKSIRASDIIIVMLFVLGLPFLLTHLVSATANPAATDTELLESLK